MVNPIGMIPRKYRAPLAVAVAALGVAGWYWFRPERAFIDARVSEAAPATAAATVASGQFAPMTHKGRGTAEILRGADGRPMLRFTNFETLNGPDLRVYLLGAASVHSKRELDSAGFLDLGALKGNVGDQNYEIPADADLSRYRAVSVWCRRFGVNFTTAPLTPGS